MSLFSFIESNGEQHSVNLQPTSRRQIDIFALWRLQIELQPGGMWPLCS